MALTIYSVFGETRYHASRPGAYLGPLSLPRGIKVTDPAEAWWKMSFCSAVVCSLEECESISMARGSWNVFWDVLHVYYYYRLAHPTKRQHGTNRCTRKCIAVWKVSLSQHGSSFISSKIHSSSCLTHWNPNSSLFSPERKIKPKLLITNKLRKKKVGLLMFLYNTGIENEVVDFRELFCWNHLLLTV